MRIRVHRCQTEGSARCSCRELVSTSEARARLLAGTASSLPFKKPSGEVVANDRAIAMVPGCKPLRRRRVEFIEVHHLERAYGCGGESGNVNERNRIDAYGELARFAGRAAWSEAVRDFEAPVKDVPDLPET